MMQNQPIHKLNCSAVVVILKIALFKKFPLNTFIFFIAALDLEHLAWLTQK